MTNLFLAFEYTNNASAAEVRQVKATCHCFAMRPCNVSSNAAFIRGEDTTASRSRRR